MTPRGGLTAWSALAASVEWQRGCQEAQVLRWHRRTVHAVASVTHRQDQKGTRERGTGDYFVLGITFPGILQNYCRVITEQPHSCSVPSIPTGQIRKKIRERNDQSYSLHKERSDMIVQT